MSEDDCVALQEEEVEVLKSIYEGDQRFNVIDQKTFQYKLGPDGEPRSCIIQVKLINDFVLIDN